MELQIGSVISAARRQKGLTQEALADLVGVSAAAVSKWETGASYPDITLLSPVARALHITVDELLCFHQTPTEAALEALCKSLSQVFEADGYAAGQAAGERALQEYPRCGALKLRVGGLYQSYLLLALKEMEEAQGEAFAHATWARILTLFEQAETELSDAGEQLGTRFLRACTLLQLGRTDEAKCLLDSFPRQQANPEQLYPSLYLARGELDEAEKSAARQLLSHAISCFTAITSLSAIAQKREDREQARRLVALAAALDEAFGLNQPGTRQLALQCALADGQINTALEAAEQYLAALVQPTPNYVSHPLFSCLSVNCLPVAQISALQQAALKMLAEEPQFAPLRTLPAFGVLLERFAQQFDVTG